MSHLRALYFGFPVLLLFTVSAHAADRAQVTVGNTGISGLWLLANLSYAGMRAQGSRSTGWRILAFIFGFPGTLLSFLVVEENGERAYGVELPRRHPR